MRIGVISDTHIPRRRKTLPPFVFEAFKGVDIILHAGDINDLSVLRALNKIALTEAVAGNCDSYALGNMLGYKRKFELNGYKVGLTHGHSGRGRTTMERAASVFPGADVVVFGHSHSPLKQWYDGKLMLNPGSPCDRRFEPRYSLAILTLAEAIDAEILYFD